MGIPAIFILYQPHGNAAIANSSPSFVDAIAAKPADKPKSNLSVVTDVGSTTDHLTFATFHRPADPFGHRRVLESRLEISTPPKSDLAKEEVPGAAILIQAFITEQTEPLPVELDPPAPAVVTEPVLAPPAIAQEAPEPANSDLGAVREPDLSQDPELGTIQVRTPLQDPELGIVQLRVIPPEPPDRPYLFVSSYVTAASSDNIFLVDYPIQGRIGDKFIRPGVSLLAFPSLGPNTNFLASVETNFLRYQDFTETSYDELRFRAGIRHNFSDAVYGQVNWNGQLLYDVGFKDQFFGSHGVELILGRRDTLLPGLTLNSFYQGQLDFTNPSQFSSLSQSLGVSLGYRFNPQWDTGISYRITISDFTEISRHETYQRITGQLRYSINPSIRMSIFGGLSYGQSSEADVSFDDSFFGISIDATLQIF